MVSTVMLIWSASSAVGRENLAYGLQTHTWGFRAAPESSVDGRSIDYVIFGQNFSEGSVRVSADRWRQGTVDLIVAEAGAPPYVGTAPHWPDEALAGQVIYPYRFGFTPLGRLFNVPVDGRGPLPEMIGSQLRLAAIGNRPATLQGDVTSMLAAIGTAIDPATGSANLSSTSALSALTTQPRAGSLRARRSTDRDLRKAVEDHSVAMAIAHMRSHGYSQIEELGKPFDLVCRTPTSEKHVEVKGTTGAGVEVEYTVNEVVHFRECPFGADLIVVRDITVDRTTSPYSTSGGELLHVEDYTAPDADLQASRWLGRVSGWRLP